MKMINMKLLRTTKIITGQLILFVFWGNLLLAQAQDTTVKVVVNADHTDWLYKPGETVHFTVSATEKGKALKDIKVIYAIGREKMPAEKTATITLTNGSANIDGGTMKEPGFLRCTVIAVVNGKKYTGLATAGFSPEQIRPTTTEPADFIAFWDSAKKAAAAIPMDVKMELLKEKSTDKVNVYLVSIQNYRIGNRVYGMLAVPKKEGKFPAVLEVPGAGVRPYKANTRMAENDVISLQIGIHGIPVNMDSLIYDNLRIGALYGYQTLNLDDKDEYYYKRVYMGCVRAVDFIFSLPQFDGKNICVSGGSQGGALSIVTAALDNRITCLASFYPALSDMTGYLNDRAGGWPHMFANAKNRTPAKIETSRYYDVVNFARHLKVPGLYSWGYNDLTCPPTSTYSSYNIITAPKQLLIAKEIGHFSVKNQVDKKNEWMLTILKAHNTKYEDNDKTLREAYKDYFPVGAAVGYNDLKKPEVARLITTQFASITPENELKPTRLQAKQGQFTWTMADEMVDFAVNNHLKVRGHTLVWPFKMPRWMYTDGNKLASKELLLNNLKTYIQTVVGRYKGKIYCWDVVNEAISYIPPDKLDTRTDTLYEIAGEEYIEKAFEYAHEADPNARLFYNDNGEEWSKKRDKVYAFLKKMKAKGIPVHGVGFQAHWGIEGLPESYLKETIKKFNDIGIEVQITELDISIYPKRINNHITKPADLVNYNEEYTSDIQQQQAAVFDMIFRVCRENKGKVSGLTLWSSYDWPNYLTRTYNKKNYPYLFDENLQPKAVVKTLTGF